MASFDSQSVIHRWETTHNFYLLLLLLLGEQQDKKQHGHYTSQMYLIGS